MQIDPDVGTSARPVDWDYQPRRKLGSCRIIVAARTIVLVSFAKWALASLSTFSDGQGDVVRLLFELDKAFGAGVLAWAAIGCVGWLTQITSKTQLGALCSSCRGSGFDF